MKIHFFGTCGGTEPIPNRKHSSFAVEANDIIYWFDAGEGCSYTASLMGIDLLKISCIFISHTHMDHVGGLGNLLWNIRKINSITFDKNKKITGKDINVFIPNMKTWDGIMQILKESDGNFKCDFNINPYKVKDGHVYSDENIRVFALHNLHLPTPADGEWKSFSYAIQCEGKMIVYSGDVGNISDIDQLIKKCDLLLMETGHHTVEGVCNYIKENNKDVGALCFTHNGRAIIKDEQKELQKARDILGDKVFIAKDEMTIEI